VLSNAELDALLAEAGAAEAAGETEDAFAMLTVAAAELLAQGKTYQYPFEWMARLASALGDHGVAERAAMVGRQIAEEASHGPGVLRMDVLRAEIARAALDLPRAEALLAGLAGDGGPLGAPAVERLPAILAWLRALRFGDHPRQNLGVLRVEIAHAIVELWAERGRYRSALRLLDAIEPELAGAEPVARADQAQLLRAELLLEAGAIAEAARRLDASPAPAADPDRLRRAVVQVRVALAAGRLAEAVAQLELLAAAPAGDPRLFASAVATRIAVLVELNLLEAAQEAAAAGIAQLAAGGAAAHLVALLERARSDAAARGRSAMALWELPFAMPCTMPFTRDVEVPGEAATPPAEPVGSAGAPSRFTAAWTAAANGVLGALERGALDEAAGHQARLEAIAGGVESESVACRVELSAALVAYYRGGADAARFLAVADRLHAMGARLAEAQAVRFAAWASARLRRADDYAALVGRASEILDEIAGELDPRTRALFLMNKWSGRDELVSARVRELLRGGDGRLRRPGRRALCRAFREIDELTHWPIGDALGELDAARLAADATPDRVMAWVREQLEGARVRARAARGIAIHSPWSLWRFPARTLVLHYHVLPDRTFLFRIARRHIDISILPVGRVHLAMDMREAAADEDQLRWLAEHTGIAAALERFGGIERLVIVPHDAIANVPFAALPVGGRPLCAAVPITQVDRLTRLQRRRARPRPRPGPVLGIGRTDYRGSGYPDLPAAEREAEAVLAALGKAGELRRGATCRTVRAELPGAARCHIAAHGVFDPIDPAQSGIVLGDGRGGFETLTLRELRRIDLRGLELATLATCRSAAHASLPGRERICLPTALLDAGARGVIASMWPVEDEPSMQIMTALYEELRHRPPAGALAAMQARMAARHPARRWAGFVFYGND
jgi:hypothetical protein